MKRPDWRFLQRHIFQCVAITAIATGCGTGNGGCGLTDGIQPLSAPLPREATLENGIQVRLTNQGFAFVEQNLGAIISSVIGDHICVPADVFDVAGFTGCPSDPNEENPPLCDLNNDGVTGNNEIGCRVNINLDSANFDLDQSGNNALLRTQLQMDFDGVIPLDEVFNQTCDAFISASNMVADATVQLSINQTNRQLQVNLNNINLADLLQQLNIEITSENGSDPFPFSVCDITGGALSAFQSDIANLIIDLLEPVLIGFIDDQIQSFVPNPPGLEGRIDLAALLGAALPIPLQGQLELSMVAGGYARAETSLNTLGADPAQRGLSLGMRAAINSDFTPFDQADGRSTPNPCVRTLPLPLPGVPSQFANGERFLERAGEFAQNVIPGTTTPYDAGIGISEAFLNNFGFHMFNSGMLCIGIGTETLGAQLLSSDSLKLLLPSIGKLVKTPDGVLPVFIQLRPQAPPNIFVGSGAQNDPLLRIAIRNMDLDMFVLMDDRLVRLFTANTSFDLGVNIEIDAPAGTIIPTLDTSQLLGLQVGITNSEMLSEPPESIANILPTLIQIALPALANVIGPITPPVVGGFGLDLTRTSIQRVQANLGNIGNENFLAIFAGLTFDPNAGKAVYGLDPVNIKAKLVGVSMPGSLALTPERLDASRIPAVQLELDGDDYDMEYQFRVDNGMWSPFTKNANPVLREPLFMLQGEHTIEVRGQKAGHPETQSEINVVKVRIDTVSPSVSLRMTEEGSVVADISDVGTTFGELERMYRVDSGDWVSLPANGIVTPEMMQGGVSVEVMVNDKAGHSTVRSIDRIQGSSIAGCTVSQESSQNYNVLFAIGAVIGFLLVLRRRQSRGLKALGASLVLAAGITGEGCACGGVCVQDADCANVTCADGEFPICDRANAADPNAAQCACVEIENGDVGRFSDVAADGGDAVVVAYNTTFGDLVLIRVTPTAPVENGVARTSLQELDFVFVDGVPGDTDGVRSNRDAGPNVGQDASVTIDASGNAHIAYLDVDNGDLKYARVGSNNQIQAVMTVDADSGFVGRYTDIIIGANGNPQISYMAPDVAGTSQLRFVAANSASPTAAADWQQPQIVDNLTAIPADPENLLDLPKGVGLFTSMSLRANGATRINYFDSINNDLKRAQSSGADPSDLNANVIKLDADANGNDLGRIGKYCSLFVDANDGFHQLELNEDNSSMIYFGTASQFFIETVDSGVRNDGGVPVQHKVGGDATLIGTTINGQFELFAAYHDGTSLDVNVTQRNDDGTWTPHVVSGNEQTFEGSKGFFTAIAISGNNPSLAFIVDYIVDQQEDVTNFELLTVDLSALP